MKIVNGPGVVKISVIVLATVVVIRGVVDGSGVVVVTHGYNPLTIVSFAAHVAVIQCPSPSVVL